MFQCGTERVAAVEGRQRLLHSDGSSYPAGSVTRWASFDCFAITAAR